MLNPLRENRGSRGRPRLGRLGAFVLLVVLPLACAPRLEHGAEGRGVLVIAIDSLRSDHLSLAGYDRRTTPALDRLAGEGIWFSDTFAAAPAVVPAHAGILTGCDPRLARQPMPEDIDFLSLSRKWRIPPTVPSMAVEFLAAGYATSAFIDHSWLAGGYGFHTGFEEYRGFQGGLAHGEHDFGAAGMGRAFLDWLGTIERDGNWFAYLNVNDLERGVRESDPRWDTYFEPRPELSDVPPVSCALRSYFAIPQQLWPGGSRTVGEYEARYDGSLRKLDDKLERLFAQLELLGRLEETTICIIGTYGIGFGESGLYLDHGTLSDVDLAVPWILRPAKSIEIEGGVRSGGVASTIDVAPTLLDLHGIEVPRGMHGKSHAPSSTPEGGPVRRYAFSSGGLGSGFAVHDEQYSYQYTTPGALGNSDLRKSWYGRRSAPGGHRREFLRDRWSGSGPGDLGASAVNVERVRLLRARGEAWFEWMEKARLALHDPPWMEDAVSGEVRRELVERGLIGQ
jgi:arylsulfatase A-like enzyme